MGKLRFVETTDTRVPLSTLTKGDVFFREGALCMRVETMWDRPSERPGFPIVNLCTGRVWHTGDDMVDPVGAATITITKP